MTTYLHRKARAQIAVVAGAIMLVAQAGWNPVSLPVPTLSIDLPSVAQAIAAIPSPHLSIAIDIRVNP